jgi:carbon-monoxide dehydrogenase medium subunit
LAAAAVTFDEVEQKFRNVRVGAIGIGDRPIRLGAAERALEGGAMTQAAIASCAAAAAAAVDPADDIHASGVYRKTLIEVMVERALRDAVDRSTVAP